MRTPDLFGDTQKTTFNGLYAGEVDESLTGKTCKDCQHHSTRRATSRTYHKCYLMHRQWTFTATTDICLTRPACVQFQPKMDSQHDFPHPNT